MIDNIASYLFVTRIPDIHIIKENNALYHLKTLSFERLMQGLLEHVVVIPGLMVHLKD